MEKLSMESTIEETTKVGIKPIETQKIPESLETACSKRTKPRAIIFKANDKDLEKIKELIETQFPEVEIIYVTTVRLQAFFVLQNQFLINRKTLSRKHFTVLSN